MTPPIASMTSSIASTPVSFASSEFNVGQKYKIFRVIKPSMPTRSYLPFVNEKPSPVSAVRSAPLSGPVLSSSVQPLFPKPQIDTGSVYRLSLMRKLRRNSIKDYRKIWFLIIPSFINWNAKAALSLKASFWHSPIAIWKRTIAASCLKVLIALFDRKPIYGQERGLYGTTSLG